MATPWHEREGSEREHGEDKVDSTVKDARFQGGEEGKARRGSLGEAEGSMSGRVDANLSRMICRVLVSLQVWSNLKWKRRLGDEKPTHKMKE